MLRTPRDKFIASSHCAEFKKQSQTEAFEEATAAALLELQCEMPSHCTPNEAADAHNKMTGARRYVDILCSLWQSQESPKVVSKRGLDYSAGV